MFELHTIVAGSNGLVYVKNGCGWIQVALVEDANEWHDTVGDDGVVRARECDSRHSG